MAISTKGVPFTKSSDRELCVNGHICCEGTPELVASAPAYRALFGTGTQGALALYRHEHSHSHGPEGATAHHHDHCGAETPAHPATPDIADAQPPRSERRPEREAAT